MCVKILREFGGPVGVSSTFSIFSGNQQGQVPLPFRFRVKGLEVMVFGLGEHPRVVPGGGCAPIM